MPAYDAEQTLGATLDSLHAQTFADWEAIVVDDGSTDGTAALVETRARADTRLRLVRQANGGVSTARNAGIAAATGTWLAFLDADDWLAGTAFATLLEALRARPELDAVHCGWTRIAPDGREVAEICPRGERDMFAWHAHNCGFAIHAVLVRRELVERAGGFDPALTTCEDWDLWQRLSRIGARWGRVEAQLAYYRMRALSASMASAQLLRDGLVVIDRGHGPDERLAAGLELAHPDGEDASQRSRARLVHAVYASALALGQGLDPLPLFEAVDDDRCPELGSDQVAYALFEGVPLGAGTVPSDWPSLSPDRVERISDFMSELERIAGATQLARRAQRMLERLVVDAGGERPPFGRIESVNLDLELPLADVHVAANVERLLVLPRYGSLVLPPLELPASEGRVGAASIADAATEHAWALLGAFFAATVAPELEVDTSGGRLLVRRSGATLVDVPLPPDEPPERLVHDHAGWELLLQEVCGDPETSNAAFYDEAYDDALPPAGRLDADGGWAAVELAAPLPELVCDEPLDVVASVGGATLAAIRTAPARGRVSAGALRREICIQAGFELCRLAVREGLIGRPLADGASLRERLREAAERKRSTPVALALEVPADVALGPGWERHAIRALEGEPDGYVIARRRAATMGLSGSRLGVLPRLAAKAAIGGARAAGDPVIRIGAPGSRSRAVYVPDVVWRDERAPASSEARPAAGRAQEPRAHAARPGPGRAFFETLFARGADPWRYTSAYEQGKYEQTLALLDGVRPEAALELGCAEGHFTRQLAPRVERLLACDVSEIALARARQRCADLSNVSFGFHDLFADRVEGRYDLIVCSEVLYYAGDRARLDYAARTIKAALEPGGMLLTAHANLVVDDPELPGFDWQVPFGARMIGEALEGAGLDLVAELSNALYRIQAFRRPERRMRLRRPEPAFAEATLPATLPRDVEEHFLWHGGEPASDGTDEVTTWELPILMYHRVAPEGSERLHEWRVTPDQFEQQLHYLRSAGYSSASFEQWHEAAERHRPLSGRRVLLTFDDGYEDFAEHAYPLLRQYELEATVFLVSKHVGGTNEWDRGYGETLPLMDWNAIRTLDGQGVDFGGHSATHPMLTGLGLDEVAREASRCRAELVEQLGHPVRAFAYPYGDSDPAVARMVGACGFEFAVTTAGFPASASLPMLSLPRINVPGTASFDAFVHLLMPSG